MPDPPVVQPGAPPPTARPPEPLPPAAQPPAPPVAAPAPLTILAADVPAPRAYERLLSRLDEATRVTVREVSFPLEMAGGSLRVGVRKALWRVQVRDALATLALGELVEGLRRVEVVVDETAGRTGREERGEADAARREAARAAAAASAVLQRVIAEFDAEIEDIDPLGEAANSFTVEGDDDEPAPDAAPPRVGYDGA